MRRTSSFWALALVLAVLPTTGCLFRTRPVEETYSKAPLQEATQSGLIDGINQQAEKIQSLKATVDIDTSVGGAKKGHQTDYKEIRGYVLARKPAMLHMIGLLPIVRTTAFDMVSNGQEFKLWIPPKNRFVTGRNDAQTHNADQPMESIRPQDIYDALLIRPIDPEREIAVLENGEEILHDNKGHRVLQDDYELVVIRKDDQGWRLSRKIVFSRIDLQATSPVHLRQAGQPDNRRPLRELQGQRWRQLSLAHRNFPAPRGVRHHPQYVEAGDEQATEGRPVCAGAAARGGGGAS